jgi:hypothetical protein
MAAGNALNIGTAGYVVFDGTSTFSGRTFQAGSGISLTNASGVAGNTTISASGAAPNANIMISDDFFGANATSSILISQLAWQQGAVFWQATQATEGNHPGLITNQNFATTAVLFLRDSVNTTQNVFVLGGGVLVVDWVFNIGTLSTANPRYILQMGLGTTDNADQVNGCYFEYSDNLNTGQWNLKTANASTRTTTASATAVTTGWHHATITVNAAASSVSFVMDGVTLGTITTNIPTAAISPFLSARATVGTVIAGSLIPDLFYLTQTLTTPR